MQPFDPAISMIHLPAYGRTHDFLLYGDSADAGLCYVDPTCPHSTKSGSTGTWHSLPGGKKAFFVGEIAFGFEGLGERLPAFVDRKHRPVSMPWEPTNVFAWTLPHERQTPPDNPSGILCSGRTSGYGIHNCVLQSKALPADTMRDPILASAWFECPGRFAGGSLEAEADARAVSTALEAAAESRPEIEHLPLGYVLVQVLRTLLDKHVVRIATRARAFSSAALEAARDLVLTEWAHRIAESVGRVGSLAKPWRGFTARTIPRDVPLDFRWDADDAVVLRVLRTHRFPPSALAGENHARAESATTDRRVEVVSKGNWASFDFVEVRLRSGDSEEHLTLERRSGSGTALLEDVDPAKVEITARGALSGLGKGVALRSRWRGRRRIEIELPAVQEVAFLLKAERAWLRTVGPLKIQVAHDRLARFLQPEDGVAALDPAAGELGKVSAVVRALLWGERLEGPFRFRIDLGHGFEIAWDAVPENGDVLVTERDVALLRVRCPRAGILPVAIEAGISVTGTGPDAGIVRSLGEKTVTQNTQELAWVVPSDRASVRVRSRFEDEGRSLVTPWSGGLLGSSGPLAVSSARLLPIVVLSLERDREVEIVPAEGDLSEAYRTITRAGKPAKLGVLCAARAGAVKFRVRPLPAGDWSAWNVSETNLIRISP